MKTINIYLNEKLVLNKDNIKKFNGTSLDDYILVTTDGSITDDYKFDKKFKEYAHLDGKIHKIVYIIPKDIFYDQIFGWDFYGDIKAYKLSQSGIKWDNLESFIDDLYHKKIDIDKLNKHII